MQTAMTEPGMDVLSTAYVSCITDDLPVVGLDYRVATAQCGQRADRIQCLAACLQSLPAAFDLKLHQLSQTLCQVSVLQAEIVQHGRRLMALQATVQVLQVQPLLFEALAHTALQALFQFIESLGLLQQALPGVQLLQAFCQPQ